MTPQQWKHTWHVNRPRKSAITQKEAIGRAQASSDNGRRKSPPVSLAPLPEALREKGK